MNKTIDKLAYLYNYLDHNDDDKGCDMVREIINDLKNLSIVDSSFCEHDFQPCKHPALYEFDKCIKCGKIR